MSQEKSPKPADEIVPNNVRNDETANRVERVQVQGIRLIHLLQKSARIGGLLLVVWLVGCLGFSVTWVVVGSLAYGALSEYWRNKKAQSVVVTAVDVENLARIDELPQWVYFPDSERAEWLNKVILKMWPNIGVYINNLLKKQIELLVNSALPASLTPFKFEEVHLGTVPPRIGGVKTYVDNVRRDEIILDAEIMYAGDTSLTVSLRGFRAGVKDITVNGVVRIIFRPLVNKIPIIGGLSVFFLKPPNIDFDLTNLTNALELPLISLTLRTIVNDQLANYAVLPHKIPVQLLDLQDLESILFNTPRGVVRLTAVRAADLIVADKKLIGKGSSDPYCRITVGSQTVETKVVEKCLDPTWNETFEFIVTTEEVLLVEVFDKDQTGTDDFLGRIRINLTELASSSSVDKWFDLTDVKSGKIYLSIKWFQLVKDSSALEKAKQQNELDDCLSSAVLMVIVDSIKNLPAVKKFKKMMTQRAGAEPSPFVSIKVGNIKQLTEVRQNSTNPKWDKFQFNFLVNGSVTQDLSIEVIDDNNKNGQALGSRKVPLRDVLSSNEMTVCRPYGLRNSGPDTTIVLRLAMRILSLDTPTSVCEEKALSTAVCDASNAGPVIEAGGCKTAETAGQQTGLAKATESTSPAVVTQKTPDVNENKDVRATAVAVATTAAAAAAGSSPLNSSYVGGASQSVAGSDGSQLRQRRSSSRFGRIQLTIQCSSRTKLTVTVHQCSNLIPCDADNLADPYVKLFLLPDRSSAGKRKTNVVKNNLNPTFNATFEWSVDIANLGKHTLEVFVKNEVGLFAKGRVNMGVLHVDLSKIDVATKPVTDWYDLQDPDSAQFKD